LDFTVFSANGPDLYGLKNMLLLEKL